MKYLLISLFLTISLRAETDQSLNSFLASYCYKCHDADVQEADFDIEKMFSEKPLVSNLKKWHQLIYLIKEGDMPPKDKKKQPTGIEKEKFISLLEDKLNNFDYSKIKNPGTEFSRRLTNKEYENTVNDLFGIRMEFAHKMCPDLKSADSFSNNSRTLFIQTPVLEKFYATAEYVVEKALPVNSGNEDIREKVKLFFESGNAEEVLRTFAQKAYRRPVSKTDFQNIMKVYQNSRNQYSHEKSIRDTLEFILSSPRFLFKIENHDPDERVGHYEMASRLSYFLWGTKPDKELFNLASDKKLRDNSVLKQQVMRMLKSPKSLYLGNSLGAEWLKYNLVGVRNRPDPIDNKFMTGTIYESMFKESAFFYTYLHKANRPIEELITARYTFLNEELANYYRIGGVKGYHMRPVRLKTAHRGGILTHASILMVTSHPDRRSPVLRGDWILSSLLGTPPPPPPANIAELDEDEEIPLERRIRQHSRKKQCAACHSKIDPLGLAMDNFDYFGRWTKRPGAVEKLHDGTELGSLEDLKNYLSATKLKTLKRNTVERSLSFALGRQLYYYDEPAILKILAELEKPNAGFQDMLVAIVQSYPFKFNRAQQEN